MPDNPILSRARNIVIYLLLWLLLFAVYFSMLYYGLNIKPETIALDFIFNLLLCGVGIILWYPARYLTFEDNSLTKIIFSHIFGGILTSVLWLGIGYLMLINLLSSSSGYMTFFRGTLLWRFIFGLMFYLLAVSFYYMFIYYKNLQERINKESELRSLITEAELKTLKFQINPHFIFNSLNSMSALTAIDPERARSMILKLADFLRYTLANNEKQSTSLSEELRNIRLYLEIEKIRFEDKFEYIEEVNNECKEVMIPNMILQPLFENAIKHAVYESLEKVTLKLTCGKEGAFFKIILENNIDAGYSSTKGTGIGLQNIKNRLELIYHRPDLLDVKREHNLFKVTLYIPV